MHPPTQTSHPIERAPREVCWTCRRPRVVCWCGGLPRIETRTRVVVLQHPRERDVPIGTARMAALCLAGAELHVGVDWDGSPELSRAVGDPGRPPVLLYPGPGAIDVLADPPRGPVTLVVVDGTWWQARNLVRRSAVLAGLPRYTFVPPRPSDYRIRKEPSAECVSTIEALVYVLGALEGDPARFVPMLEPFRRMVDAQIAYTTSRRASRQKRSRTARPIATRVPRALLERREDLVCVIGEANAWPHRDRRHEDELVRWIAYRPATREIFDAIARPMNPLAPLTTARLGLDERTLLAGSTMADVVEMWRAFARETDVVCTWSKYGARMFATAGAQMPARTLDLRDVVRVVDGVRPGALEAYEPAGRGDDHAMHGRGLVTWPEGRGGLRVARLAAILAHLRAKAGVPPP
jgi:DTW domain-containing protein YfiP